MQWLRLLKASIFFSPLILFAPTAIAQPAPSRFVSGLPTANLNATKQYLYGADIGAAQ